MDSFNQINEANLMSALEAKIKTGSDINAQDVNGRTILYKACEIACLNVVRLAVNNGARPDIKEKALHFLPLHAAAQNGHDGCVSILLEHPQSKEMINSRSKSGETALWLASYRGHSHIVEILLSSNAEVDLPNEVACTPLNAAVQNNRKDVVVVLLQNKADPNLAMDDLSTPLYQACSRGFVEIAKLLLENDADPEAQFKTGATPFMAASFHNHVDIARLLVQFGANYTVSDRYGNTGMHLAAQKGSIEMMRCLMEMKLPMVRNTSYQTPLDVANDRGFEDVVSLLETYNPNDQDVKAIKHLTVTIDIGNNYSGYAYSYAHSDEIHLNPSWVSKDLAPVTGSGIEPLYKTPTSVCVKNGRLVAFGFEAQEAYCEAEPGETLILYENFKTQLNHNKAVSRSMLVTSWDGQHSMSGLDLFGMVLNCIKDKCLVDIAGARKYQDEGSVQWVLTVPATWTDTQKMFMREAAVKGGLIQDVNDNSLTLALDNESATLQCTKPTMDSNNQSEEPSKSSSDNDTGSDENDSVEGEPEVESIARNEDIKREKQGSSNEYVLIDIGGGSTDISCFKKLSSGGCEELHEPIGKDIGASKINDNFYSLLQEILGPEFLQHCKKINPSALFQVMLKFEQVKKELDEEMKHLNVPIAKRFAEAFAKYSGKQLMEKVDENATKDGICLSHDSKLHLPCEVVKSMFDPIVEEILSHLKALLSKEIVSNAQEVLFVGGFSRNRYLQSKVRENLQEKKITIPDDPEICVVKGAAIYDSKPDLIQSRISGRTYCFKAFRSSGEEFEEPYLTCVIEKGESVPNGFKVLKYCTPLDSFMSNVTMELYAADGPFNERLDDPQNYPLGSVDLECPVKGGVRLGGNDDRIQEFTFTFGGTEIWVEGRDCTSGHKANTTINFMSN